MQGMPGFYLSYFGIRVTDLERSLGFYRDVLGLEEIRRGDNSPNGGGTYVLLRDPWSGQKLELNWYPPGSRHAHPYLPGEGLDHIAFRVDDLPRFLEKLRREGAEDTGGVADHVSPSGNPVAYVKDPDGNWLEVYSHSGPMPSLPPEGY